MNLIPNLYSLQIEILVLAVLCDFWFTKNVLSKLSKLLIRNLLGLRWWSEFDIGENILLFSEFYIDGNEGCFKNTFYGISGAFLLGSICSFIYFLLRNSQYSIVYFTSVLSLTIIIFITNKARKR